MGMWLFDFFFLRHFIEARSWKIKHSGQNLFERRSHFVNLRTSVSWSSHYGKTALDFSNTLINGRGKTVKNFRRYHFFYCLHPSPNLFENFHIIILSKQLVDIIIFSRFKYLSNYTQKCQFIFLILFSSKNKTEKA